MKINSINTNFNTKNYNYSFKHSAVPYPEYKAAYFFVPKSENILDSFIEKVTALFNPDVKKDADIIKNQIDKIYAGTKESPKQAMLSVLA